VANATNRSDLVRMLVLNEICDDYENLTISIMPPVVERGRQCGVKVEKSDLVRALNELIESGLAKAYWLRGDGRPVEEFETMPTLSQMEDPYGAWFLVTEEGLKIHRTNGDFWPFHEDDELRQDWIPPVN
jgi:hypothetical protein